MTDENKLLSLRDNAKADLMQIKTIEKGITHLNKLKSIETWIKAEKKDAELQNIVAEQKLRTQRLLGELIRDSQDAGEIATSADSLKNGPVLLPLQNGKKSVTDYGLSHRQSSDFKAIAGIPEDEFEAFISNKKEAVSKAVEELTTRGALKLAGKFKQSYDEEMRVTGYLNQAYARKFRSYLHYKGIDMSTGVVMMIRAFIDAISADEAAKMSQSYFSSVKLDVKK